MAIPKVDRQRGFTWKWLAIFIVVAAASSLLLRDNTQYIVTKDLEAMTTNKAVDPTADEKKLPTTEGATKDLEAMKTNKAVDPTKEEKKPPTTEGVTETRETVTEEQRHPPHFKGHNVFKIKSHGLGLDLGHISRETLKAAKEGKYLKLNWDRGYWLYGKDVCEQQDLSCFFEDPALVPVPATSEEMLQRLLIPKPEFQADINKGAKPSPGNCAVIHVRHADVVLNFRWGQSETPVLKYLYLGEYVERLKKEAPELKNVVLLTDDQDVIDDVANYEGKDGLKFHYLERKRFRGAEGGWENHFPSGNRYNEMVTIMQEKEFVSKCSLWVGTESGFARVLQTLMNPKPRVVYLDNSVPVKKREVPVNLNK